MHRPFIYSVMLPATLVVAITTTGSMATAATTSVAPDDATGQPVGSTRLISLRADGSQTIKQNVGPSFSDNGRFVTFTTEDREFTSDGKIPCCQAIRYDRKTKTSDIISQTAKGKPSNRGGNESVMSANGNIIAFWSSSTNLVAGDTNDEPDIFLRNMTSGTTTLISQTPSGKPSNGDSRIPSISADGTRIAFQSVASNLGSGDTNQVADIFVYDTKTKKVTLISRGTDGKSAKGESLQPEISADGSHVVYESSANNIVADDTNPDEDIFAYDIASGTTQIISVAEDGSPANGGSHNPAVSGDALFVTFWSFASNLAPNDDNGAGDVFVRTTDSPKITLVSHTPDGHSGSNESDDPAISTDGRTIAFQSAATDLDPGDDNGVTDVYRYDLSSGLVVLVSATPKGGFANDSSFLPSLSGEGGFVAFESIASDLIAHDDNGVSDIFVVRLE